MKTDYQIQQDVLSEIKWEPLLHAAEIGVSVKDGVVTLSGILNSYSKKLIAEKAARRVAGVKAVAEDIAVRILPDSRKSDTELAAAVLNALKWHSIVQEDRIKIKVEDGWVTLDGEAEWGFQKEAAESAVENLRGVNGVINNIILIPKVEVNDVKKHISTAFHRSATIDASRVHIDLSGDKVILTGKVRSLAEKRDAERAAWLAPGVREVVSRLEVEKQIYAL